MFLLEIVLKELYIRVFFFGSLIHLISPADLQYIYVLIRN